MLKEAVPAEYRLVEGRGEETRSRQSPGWLDHSVPTGGHRREAMKLTRLLSPFDRWRNRGTEQLQKSHSK